MSPPREKKKPRTSSQWAVGSAHTHTHTRAYVHVLTTHTTIAFARKVVHVSTCIECGDDVAFEHTHTHEREKKETETPHVYCIKIFMYRDLTSIFALLRIINYPRKGTRTRRRVRNRGRRGERRLSNS